MVYACVDALAIHECVGLSPNLNGSVEAGGEITFNEASCNSGWGGAFIPPTKAKISGSVSAELGPLTYTGQVAWTFDI